MHVKISKESDIKTDFTIITLHLQESIYLSVPLILHRGTRGTRRRTHWTITEHNHADNLEMSVSLLHVSLSWGQKRKYLEETLRAQGEHTNPTEIRLEPQPWRVKWTWSEQLTQFITIPCRTREYVLLQQCFSAFLCFFSNLIFVWLTFKADDRIFRAVPGFNTCRFYTVL